MSSRRGKRRRLQPEGWHEALSRWPTVAVVAVGGAAGAAARHGAALIWPTGPREFPWTTLGVNAVGCFLIGVLMVALKERFTSAPKLLNPLLGTGVLGGFTTFSTYTDDVRRLLEDGPAGHGVGYLVLTVAAALAGVSLGVAVGRVAFARRAGGKAA